MSAFLAFVVLYITTNCSLTDNVHEDLIHSSQNSTRSNTDFPLHNLGE